MSVAPRACACSSFSGATSIATIRSAPRAARPGRRRARRRRSRSRRPWSPPAPASPRERLPRPSRSRRRAAPPARPAAPPGIFTAHASCTTAWSANVAAAQHRRQQRAVGGSVQPPLRAELRGAAALIAPPALRALAARRAPGDDDAVAGSDRGSPRSRPLRRCRRPRGRAGSGTAMPQPFVSTTWRSEWQSPQARTRTSTSRGPGGSTVSSSTAGAASGSA